MWKGSSPLILALAAAVVFPSPAECQLWFSPDYALPAATKTPFSWFAGSFTRNWDNSLWGMESVNGLVASAGRATGRASFMGSIAYVDREDPRITVGGTLAFELNSGPGPRLSIQSGIGWAQYEMVDATLLRIPIGVALKTDLEYASTTVTPWLMPRANVSHLSSENHDTELHFGMSTGAWVTTRTGFGFQAALDALFVDGNADWHVSGGFHFRLGGHR